MEKNTIKNYSFLRLTHFKKYEKTARLRWECIRRNKNYINAFKHFEELLEASEYKPEDQGLKEIPVLEGFCFYEYPIFTETEAYRFAVLNPFVIGKPA